MSAVCKLLTFSGFDYFYDATVVLKITDQFLKNKSTGEYNVFISDFG